MSYGLFVGHVGHTPIGVSYVLRPVLPLGVPDHWLVENGLGADQVAVLGLFKRPCERPVGGVVWPLGVQQCGIVLAVDGPYTFQVHRANSRTLAAHLMIKAIIKDGSGDGVG